MIAVLLRTSVSIYLLSIYLPTYLFIQISRLQSLKKWLCMIILFNSQHNLNLSLSFSLCQGITGLTVESKFFLPLYPNAPRLPNLVSSSPCLLFPQIPSNPFSVFTTCSLLFPVQSKSVHLVSSFTMLFLQFCPTKGLRTSRQGVGQGSSCDFCLVNYVLLYLPSPHTLPSSYQIQRGQFLCFLLFRTLGKKIQKIPCALPRALLTPFTYNFHQCDSREQTQNFVYYRKLRTDLGFPRWHPLKTNSETV